MRTLKLTGHGTWRTQLDNGVVIELGRGEPGAVGERAARFVRTLPQLTATLQRPLVSADLRHPDGYAVRLQGVTTTTNAPRR
jgi:cell division protein FtsQ